MLSQIPIMLLTSANCKDAYLDNIRREREAIEEALQGYEDENYIRIRKKAQTSSKGLIKQFQRYREQIVIFHFSGHASGEHLQLEGVVGEEMAQAKGIAAWLSEMPNLELVFLNGCATQGQVERLLEKGVKAVIATSVAINDNKAAEFGIAFYNALANKETLGQAFKNAKNVLETQHKNTEIAELDQTRGLKLRRDKKETFPWGLYRNDDAVLDWKLPTNRKIVASKTKLLTSIPFVDKDEIIGRSAQIDNIHEELEENKTVLLVNGIGGIGKTAVAKAYMSEHRADYDHLVWLTISSDGESGLMNTFVNQNDLIDNLELRAKWNTLSQTDNFTQRAFEMILNAMRLTAGNNLLVLDNANDKTVLNDHYRTLKNTTWKVVLTSRAQSSHYEMIAIDELPMSEAKDLFYRFYKKEQNDVLVEELLTTIERHTLLTELFAKAAQKANLSLNNLNQQILRRKKVATGESGQDVEHRPTEAKVRDYILYIFKNITELDEDEKRYLRYFSILPIEEHEIDFLKSTFKIEETTEELFEDTIESLVEKGWLIDNNGLFRIHPLIQEVVIEYLKPNTENCLVAIESVSALVHINYTKDNPIDKFTYLPYGLSILKNINEETLAIAYLADRIGYIYEHKGFYKISALYKEKALAIATSNKAIHKVATYQSNLANTYFYLGKYNQAAKLLEVALETIKFNFEQDHSSITMMQANLALVYCNLRRHEEAIDLLKNSLITESINLELNHPNIAIRQSTLARIYKDLGRYEEATELLELVLVSNLTNFELNHPNIAESQSNLANLYSDLGRYKEAIELLESSLESHLENFGQNHLNVADCKFNLAGIYIKRKNYSKAIQLLDSSYQLYSQFLDKHHPTTISAKRYLDYCKQKQRSE